MITFIILISNVVPLTFIMDLIV